MKIPAPSKAMLRLQRRPKGPSDKAPAEGRKAAERAEPTAAPAMEGKVSDADQLSDYERKPRTARATAPPDIPPPSERWDQADPAARAPLTFAPKGKVKLVAKDQEPGWPTDKSRLVKNPERLLHPILTIQDKGGWLIDHSAPPKPDPKTGEAIPTYFYQPPKTPVRQPTNKAPSPEAAGAKEPSPKVAETKPPAASKEQKDGLAKAATAKAPPPKDSAAKAPAPSSPKPSAPAPNKPPETPGAKDPAPPAAKEAKGPRDLKESNDLRKAGLLEETKSK